MPKIITTIGKILVAIGNPFLVVIELLLVLIIRLLRSLSKLLNHFLILLSFIGNLTIQLILFLAKLPRQISKAVPKIALPHPPISISFPIGFRIPLISSSIKSRVRYFLFGFLFFLFFIFLPFWVRSELAKLPDPHLLAVRDIPVSSKIYDRNGVLLYSFYANEDRSIVALADLPQNLVNATLAIEDKNFYHHPGFDLSGIFRAVLANSFSDNKSNPQGGSTLTQQLIKYALLSPEKTYTRKLKEIFLAFWAERIFSKNEILTMYLNQVPYGGAAYGIESASQTYFGTHAKDLDLAQSALLAGLPSAPSIYSPFGAYPELARLRQQQVLEAMASQGYISADQKNQAEAETLPFTSLETSIKAPHFVMYVKDILAQKYGLKAIERGGLQVTTSLDYPLYEIASQILHDGVTQQKNLNVSNGAVLVTSPQTGEVLAMVGSIDYFDKTIDGNVNVTTSSRSPGSSIKPLNYALALEKGLITPATILDDSPVTYHASGAPDYSPQNYDGKFHGKIPVRTALASSYNVPAVKVLEKNGVENLRLFAQSLGITTWEDKNRYGLSLTLGGGEVKMTELSQAYSVFANQGTPVPLKPILRVKDFRGNVLEDNVLAYSLLPTASHAISPQTAFQINSILSDNSARTPAFGPNSALNIPGHTVAVKTGTTETKRDNWTVGYNFGPESKLVAVWVGNNDNSPMSPNLESGNTGAAAIWNPIITSLLKDTPDSPLVAPDGIVSERICLASESARLEFFRAGTEPKNTCRSSQ